MPRMVEYRLLNKMRREKLEKELTVRFLIDSLLRIEDELQHLVDVKSPCQRLTETHKLLRKVRDMTKEFKDVPRRNFSFYNRRLGAIDDAKE